VRVELAPDGAPERARTSGADRSGERGVALVIVLWVVAFLAVILAAFVGEGQMELRIARNRLAETEAEAAADAGVALAVSTVAATLAALRAPGMPLPDGAWVPDGSLHELRWNGADLRLRIDSEAGKIDLNATSEHALAALFLALGVNASQASGLGAAIVAWRHDRAAALGIDNSKPGRRISDQPAGPFFATDELKQVEGMTPETYTLVAPYVTVWSGNPIPDPRTASRPVLLTLLGADSARIDEWIAARAARGPNAPIPPELASSTLMMSNLARPIVMIRSAARTRAGAWFARKAVVAITGNPNDPVRVLTWERDSETAAATTLPMPRHLFSDLRAGPRRSRVRGLAPVAATRPAERAVWRRRHWEQ
jgi:general secretion pathway protein K